MGMAQAKPPEQHAPGAFGIVVPGTSADPNDPMDTIKTPGHEHHGGRRGLGKMIFQNVRGAKERDHRFSPESGHYSRDMGLQLRARS